MTKCLLPNKRLRISVEIIATIKATNKPIESIPARPPTAKNDPNAVTPAASGLILYDLPKL